MRLSAIVPTHNRPDALRKCLDTLTRQDASPSEFEVVIDDGSSADISALVSEAGVGAAFDIRCERQPLSGLNTARNHGVAIADGDVLGFLDDDTLVSEGWAEALLAAFDLPACSAVGGRVELRLDAPAPPWLAVRRDYLAEYDLGAEPCWLAGGPVPVGANCAVRRSEFERVGGFHPALDRLGGTLVSNGDTEFFQRLQAAGGKLRYEPRAHVFHCVPAERLTVDYFVRRHFAQGVSDQLMLAVTKKAPLRRRWARIGYELARNLPHMSNTVARDLLRGRGRLNGRFFTAYWRGRMSPAGQRAPR